MAESDIKVGSRVRHVRNGAQGVVVHMTSTGGLEVDFGGSVCFCRSVGELELDEVKPSEIRVGIQVGSTVQYVGFKRDGAQGPAGDGGLVRPPKPSGEAPPLNTDLRAHYERIVHSRLEERLRTGDAVDAMASKIYSTMLRAASPVNTVWAGSWTGDADGAIAMIVPTVPPDLPELKYGPAVNTVSTGIAALNLQAPPRPRRRHETTSWDPDMPLPDSEPGRYGWLP